MKAIIYAGIGLFSVATVYGVVDYYNTQKKGVLDNLYKEEESIPAEPEKSIVNTNVVLINAREQNSMNTNTVSKTIKKIKRPNRTIRLEEFSRGRIAEPIPADLVKPVELIKEEPKKKEEPKIVDAAITESSSIPAVIKKDPPPRKLSLDMFSRAPLRTPVKKDKEPTVTKTN
jgi:hypothetical protein